MQIEEFITLIKGKYIAENEVIQKGYYVMLDPFYQKTKDKYTNDLLVITSKRIFHFNCNLQELSIFISKHVCSLDLSPKNAAISIGYETRTSNTRSIFFYQESEAQEAFQLIAKNIPL